MISTGAINRTFTFSGLLPASGYALAVAMTFSFACWTAVIARAAARSNPFNYELKITNYDLSFHF
jgi:hypothetical protein